MVLAMKPEAVVIATGSRHLIPRIPGIDKSHVFLARDVIAEAVDLKGETAIVAGGGLVGCDTALFLSVKKQKRVIMIEQFTFEEIGFEPYDMNHMDLMKMLGENNVRIMTETKVLEITDQGVRVANKKGEERQIHADAVVISLGAAAQDSLAEALKGKGPQLYVVGDACHPGSKITNAIHQGFHAAAQI